jgi:hypothetical protein
MDEYNRHYEALENKTLTKQIDKLSSQNLKECPHCGKGEFIDYETIIECKFCNTIFFKANMEKITDPKLLISIQQIQNIIEEFELDKNRFGYKI